jgi:putative transposase
MGVEPIKNSAVKLPKIGWVQFRQSREIPSDAILKQVRVVKRVSGWYAMLALQWDVSIPDIIPQGNPVGIDVGLTNFIASSDGLLTKRPKFFIDAERKLKLLQKSVSKKRIGSNNWKRAAEKICTAARVHSQLPKRLASQAITQNLRLCRDGFCREFESGRVIERTLGQALFRCWFWSILQHSRTNLF